MTKMSLLGSLRAWLLFTIYVRIPCTNHIIIKFFFKYSEGIQAGELKHGPLALVDSTVPIILIIMRDGVYNKCMNALQQVVAREGRPILFCEKGDEETMKFSEKAIEIPRTVDVLQVKSQNYLLEWPSKS